jgi:translation elongation factor P/translation initiation factor 5A
MKTNILKWSVISLAPAAMLALASCSSNSSTPAGLTSSSAVYQPGVPGGVMVDTFKMTATVTRIDADKRKVTLLTRDGKETIVKCGPEVINFDQIRVGDQLKIRVTQELAVAMGTAGASSSDGGAEMVALAPKGAMPGGMMAGTVQATAKVTAIDLKHHKATLLLPDGTSKTFAVRPDVDLTQRKVGEEVMLRFTEAMAISVERP